MNTILLQFHIIRINQANVWNIAKYHKESKSRYSS